MKLLLLLSLSLFSLRAEVANAPCEMSFDVTGSTTSSATIDNTAKGCVLWYFTLTNVGTGSTAIAVQFSNDNTTFASSGATYTLTDSTTGTFPVTITSTAKLAGNFQDFGRYVRVTLTTSASTSHAIGTLKGYYNIAKGGTSGGGGGTYTAGTGLQLVGSEFSINSAVTQTKATDQAGTSRYCTSSTGNDTYTCTMTPTVSSYPAGMCVTLTADTANTGAASINIDTVGAASILSQSGGALSDNDITAGKPKIICSDGTNFIIQGDGGGGGGGEVANCCSAGSDGGWYMIYQGYSTTTRVWGQNGAMYCVAFMPSYKFTANQVDLSLTGSASNYAGAAIYDNTGGLVQSTATHAFGGGAFYGLYFTSTTFSAGSQYYLCVSTNSTNGTDAFTTWNLSALFGNYANTHDNTATATTNRVFTCAASSVNWASTSAPVWPSTLPTRTAASQDIPVASFSTH